MKRLKEEDEFRECDGEHGADVWLQAGELEEGEEEVDGGSVRHDALEVVRCEGYSPVFTIDGEHIARDGCYHESFVCKSLIRVQRKEGCEGEENDGCFEKKKKETIQRLEGVAEKTSRQKNSSTIRTTTTIRRRRRFIADGALGELALLF